MSFKKILRKSHTTIFFVFVAFSIVLALVHLNSTIEKINSDNSYTSNINAGSIDSGALNSINNYNKSDEIQELQEPQANSSRLSPFKE